MSETNQPKFNIFKTKLDDYYVFGNSFKNIDHSKMGSYYEIFEKNNSLRNFAEKYSTPDNRLVGIIYKGKQGDDFIAGAIVKGINEIPEGAELMKFPSSEFLVITHDYTDTEPECYPYIGMTVGFAHSENVKIPEGYERYLEYNSYMERYNFNYNENKFRTEVWFAIRKTIK